MIGKQSVKQVEKPSYFNYYNPITGGIISIRRCDKINTPNKGLYKAQKLVNEGGK